jgi:hypothetical protein
VRNVAERGAQDESLDDSGGGGQLEPDVLARVVETALGDALRLAAEAGRREIVVQLAEELVARRRGRGSAEGADPKVPRLATRSRAR